ncbi:type II CAAX endopeptidase family protein [Acaryochloris sp. IP29b_bin.137]|uniref:CPBP family intramembrane glutamic endopeptidase n=1 Tax=Acaryochloris sp. IP29b_bin.137 TaxID=2969217 RepID=UPI00263A2103|nr:type II CAAX endopeptidase family protein [Acaryochloris sp. IP29b_bin.137]
MSTGLQTIFFSRRPRRLRAGWRILTQSALELVLYILLSFIFFRNISNTSQQAFVFDRLIFLAATTISIFLTRRYLDRRSFDSLGLEINAWMPWDLLVGFLLAGLLMAGIFMFEYQVGWLTIIGYRWQQDSLGTMISESLAALLVFGLCPSWREELTYRGYWLHNIKAGLNLPLAMVLTSIAFAIPHLRYPHISYRAMIFIFLAGLWLVYAGWVTQQLWLPLGIHAGWNFFEGIVFGFPLSGLNTFRWIDQTVSGPTWVTGGDFGPEAGFVGVVAMLMGGLLVLAWSRWRMYWGKRLQNQSLIP